MEGTKHPSLLVVYFSRTGVTKLVAKSIARAAHADIEALRETRSRRGVLGWLRSGYEGTYRLSSHPLPLVHVPTDYDIVLVGSPTWNRALASPVRGFLEAHGARLSNVALFVTCGGRGAEQVLQQMRELLPHAPLAELFMLERDVRRGSSVEVAEMLEHALAAWEKSSGAVSSTPPAAHDAAGSLPSRPG
jgi:hypothetical protein